MSIENIQIIETVSLDFYNNNIKTINVKQLDTDARGVKVNCTEHGKKFKLDPLSHSAFVRYKKPDGYDVFNDCYIQDDGSVIFVLTQQMTAVVGKSNLDILVFCASGLTVENIEDITNVNDLGISTLSTMTLGLNIHPNATDLSNVESTYEYSALIDGLARHVAIEKHMENLESTINTNETQRQENESTRQTAETQRVNAETKRIDAETNRVSAEKTREENVQKVIDNANNAINNANNSAQNADDATTRAQDAISEATKKTTEMQELIDDINNTIGGVIRDDISSESTTYSSVKIDESLNKKINKSSVVNNLLTTEEGYALDARQGRELKKDIDDLSNQLNTSRYITSDEVDTGELFFGLKVYRKSFIITSTISTTNVVVDLNIDNIESIWLDTQNSFIRTLDNSVVLPIPFNSYSGSDIRFEISLSATAITMNSSGGWNSNWQKIITIKYTKKV